MAAGLKRILLVAFHYPPMSGSSGLQRTLSFSRYLSEFGWQPTVLTAHPRSYMRTSEHQMCDIPSDVVVRRAFALDASRHLSIRGCYPGIVALPDRWVSWWFGAMASGVQVIRRFRPDVIWSTYPIATAHLVGLTLARWSGVPWVADFRDLMIEDGYPKDAKRHWAHQWVESHTLAYCRRAVFVTPGAFSQYQRRHPDLDHEQWCVIANGFDEEILASLPPRTRVRGNEVTLVHSGIVYLGDRNPRHFFRAIARLRAKGAVSASTMKVRLRGSSNDDAIRAIVHEFGLEEIVSVLPPISYREALGEMQEADALLVLQGRRCNDQIPAKVYEYLALERPILALTDKAGETARFLTQHGVGSIAPIDDADGIETELVRFLGLVRSGRAPVLSRAEISLHSRRKRSEDLAELLHRVCP